MKNGARECEWTSVCMGAMFFGRLYDINIGGNGKRNTNEHYTDDKCGDGDY